MTTDIQLYNTLTRDKEPLELREPGHVSLYVCGVTPYDSMHIGHARAFITYDVLRRVLESRNLQVRHVQNVTDVDDKIINRANQLGISAQELAERFDAEGEQDLAALGVLLAHEKPRVTGHIEPIIEMVQGLEAKGFAYARGGDVYFDVSKDEDYGKLSGQKPDELGAVARIEAGELKDDPLDFALWKAAKPGEPSWESPFGPGRPGWHIECSAMALKILGPAFDIHGGARELVFPHHENEVAQSESFLDGGSFAKTWWHCGELRVGGRKMSKSEGNFVTVQDALKIAPANVWRLLFLQTHPRSPLDYAPERLEQARTAWNRLQNSLAEVEDDGASEAATQFGEKFDAALNDDLNTPLALAAVFDAVSDWNRVGDAMLAGAARRALEMLGFSLEAVREAGLGELTPRLLDILLRVRQEARERRDFKGSDALRDELKSLGVVLEDTPQGTRWKIEAS